MVFKAIGMGVCGSREGRLGYMTHLLFQLICSSCRLVEETAADWRDRRDGSGSSDVLSDVAFRFAVVVAPAQCRRSSPRFPHVSCHMMSAPDSSRLMCRTNPD